jgi:hypothetical protein
MIMSDYVPLETSRIPLEHVFKPVSNGDYLLPYTHINYIYIYITWTCQMINKIQQVTSSNHKLLFFAIFGHKINGRQVASSSTKRTRSDGTGTGTGGSGGAAKTGLSSSSSSRAPMTMDGMSWTFDVCLVSTPRRTVV